MSAIADRDRLNFVWLARLRWWAIAGQAVIVAVAEGTLTLALPVPAMMAVIAAEIAIAAVAEHVVRRERPIGQRSIAFFLVLDVLSLSALLSLSGGPFNPFSFLYLTHIAGAALVLRSQLSWLVAALALACFGMLFPFHNSIDAFEGGHGSADEHVAIHLRGMWIAFGIASGFIVYFIQRLGLALAAREEELARERARNERTERFASMATLAAGAAHELSTPLSTIAVIARELEHQTARANTGAQRASEQRANADARLIREQVDRCRDVLSQLASDAGTSAGEPLSEITGAELAHEVVRALPERDRVDAAVDELASTVRVRLPLRATVRALAGLVNNGLQASQGGERVQLAMSVAGPHLRIAVMDRGSGMAPEVLAHAGEPFFTTKPQGEGMGLGVFLARTVAEQLGGTLELHSTPGAGTTVCVTLPLATPATNRRIASAAGVLEP